MRYRYYVHVMSADHYQRHMRAIAAMWDFGCPVTFMRYLTLLARRTESYSFTPFPVPRSR